MSAGGRGTGTSINYGEFRQFGVFHKVNNLWPSPCGVMAQAEQTRLFFKNDSDSGTRQIDLAAAMTAANRVQYHQTTAKGHAQAYAVRVTAIKGSTTVKAAQNTFCTANAVTMVCAGDDTQLRHVGISKKDKATYGKRCRFALNGSSYIEDTVNFSESPDGAFVLSENHLDPYCDTSFVTTSQYFKSSGYLADDGNQIFYKDPGTAVQLGEITANQITSVVVGDGDEQPLVLLTGAASGSDSFNVIPEYRSGRARPSDVDDDKLIPTGKMATLFATAEETSDEIAATVRDFMQYKPYIPDDDAANAFDELTELGVIDSVTSATAQYPHNMIEGIAPLGLLSIDTAQNNTFMIDVLAIYEM